MLKQQIERLFDTYLQAFHHTDIESVRACYVLPCTLSTPDELKLVVDTEQFNQAFTDIFAQLEAASVTKIRASKASFNQLSDIVVSAAVEWQFYDDSEALFTEFTALYQLIKINSDWAIINVISHDISQSIAFSETFQIKG